MTKEKYLLKVLLDLFMFIKNIGPFYFVRPFYVYHIHTTNDKGEIKSC